MRIDVKKVLLLGPQSRKEEFFESAQKLGVAEFSLAAHGVSREITDPSVMRLGLALQYLKHTRDRSVSQLEFLSDEASLRAAASVIANHERNDELETLHGEYLSRLEHLQVFGVFDLDELKSLASTAGLHASFCFSKDPLHKTHYCDDKGLFPIRILDGIHYYLRFANSTDPLEGMEIFDYCRDDIPSLRRKIAAVEEEMLQLKQQQQELARYYDDFKERMMTFANGFLRTQATAKSSQLFDALFSVQAWVSEHSMDKFYTLCHRFGIYGTEVAPDEGELIPTALENRGLGKVGQDLVEIYDTPSSEDQDPSLWVFFSFALFFAMIIGDGGYGVLFLLSALWIRWRINPKGLQGRMTQLACVLSASCLAWGLLTHSFFGLEIPLHHPLRSLSLVDRLVMYKTHYHFSRSDSVAQSYVSKLPVLRSHLADDPALLKNPRELLEYGYSERLDRSKGVKIRDYVVLEEFTDSIMREIALLVGIGHLILSLLRYLRSNWCNIGWVCFSLGAYLYFPLMLRATTLGHIFGLNPNASAEVGFDLIILGMVLSVALAVIQHGWSGLLELMNVIQVFSDGLSYLRLYALGLAGAMMSATFNNFASEAPVVLGIVIIIAGHTINIILGIMGGVIHGLRLNFLEWYHYSFYGGGRMLRPLKLIQNIQSGL